MNQILCKILLFTLGIGVSFSLAAAEHLPNAAAHIGTAVINNGDQFTTNVAVTLALNAVDDGTGVSEMQFSNDEQTWSAPEPYQTSKAWTLMDDGIYPPHMNTVLRTVFVRFQNGIGAWSRAVSDSIVLARSAADVPRLAEVWIAQQLPPNYAAGDPLGSQRHPYLIPTNNNEVQFDGVMSSLLAIYQNYIPTAHQTTNPPAPATNMTSLTVHIGAGTYETHGDCHIYPDPLRWRPDYGWRIFGAGKDATTLKAVDVRYGWDHRVNVIGDYTECDNGEIADLTLDANIHEGGTNMAGQFAQGLAVCGSNFQIRRVRVKNSGSHMLGSEPSAINMHAFGVEYDNWNVILEDCEVLHPQYGNLYAPNMINIDGTVGTGGKIRYYRNVLVRNCYVDGAAYDGENPIDPTHFAAGERGNQGFGLGAVWDAVVEDSVAMNVHRGYYTDGISLHSLTLRNNHFRNILVTAEMSLYSDVTNKLRLEDNFQFNNNFVEFDPHYYTNGENWGSFGGRAAFIMAGTTAGAPGYIYNHLIFASNIFQFNDQQAPQPNVEAIPGSIFSCMQAEVQGNIYRGMPRSFLWNNDPEYLELQADILDPSRPTPLSSRNNTLSDGTVSDSYPYVLDKALPHPVVVEGNEISFPITTWEGLPITVADGLPPGAMVSGGLFRWKTSPQDAGRYIVSFYDGPARHSGPRRTLITVLDRIAPDDPHYFANGLLAWWKMDETIPALNDSSGNNYNVDMSWAVASGYLAMAVPGYAAGKKAAHFSPRSVYLSNIMLVRDPDSRLFSGMPIFYHPLLQKGTTLYHPFSIAFWFKPDGKPSRIQSLFNQTGDNSWFYCAVVPSTNAADQKVGVQFATLDMNFNLSTPTNLSASAWHQVVIVYDGTSGSIYADGLKVAGQACGQLTGYGAAAPLLIGGGVGNDGYLGALADFAIWNRPLAGAEVTRLYSQQTTSTIAPATPVAPSGLNAQIVSGTMAFLTWQDNSMNESGFVLERGVTQTSFSVVANLPRDTSTYTDTLPDPSAGYFYRVKASNSFGDSDYSNLTAVGSARPPAPTGLRIVQTGSKRK